MKTEYPPFSVLMSLYMKEQPEFLNQCLESLFNQSLQANEIVIILDGPITKKLQETLDKFKKRLPLVILPQEKNQGLGIALNIGLKACSNEYVFRMDTDDICTQNRFEVQLKYLIENPKIDILSCTIEEFNKTPGDLNQFRTVPTHENIENHIALKNPINHMGVVYKRGKIINIESYQPLESMEDYSLWLRSYSSGLYIDNIKECLIHARIGNGMLERRKGINYIKSEWLLHRLKLKSLKGHNKFKLLLIFILRASTRITPKTFIDKLYKMNRSKATPS